MVAIDLDEAIERIRLIDNGEQSDVGTGMEIAVRQAIEILEEMAQPLPAPPA